MKGGLFILRAVLLVCCGLGTAWGDAPFFRETVKHENGLVVPVPDGWAHRLLSGSVELADQRLIRSPLGATIRLEESPPGLADVETRETGQGPVAFRVETLGAYSGGTEYLLTAWRVAGESWIVLEGHIQTELGAPDLSMFWAILDATYLR